MGFLLVEVRIENFFALCKKTNMMMMIVCSGTEVKER